LAATARASLAFTNTVAEIDRFADELESTITFLREHA
jgi:cysteine desulfurase/selenocysteine lyase